MKVIFLLFSVLIGLHSYAIPDSLKNYSIGCNYLGGKIYLHTPKIHIQPPPYSQAVELSFQKQNLGNAMWQQLFGFPETSLNIAFASHGEKSYGYAIGFYPSILFRFINFRSSYLYYKIGGGIGINTRHWKRIPYADSMNNILGSTVNNFTMFQIGYRQKISTHWSTQIGFDFYHVSNAGARKPNFGINTIGAFVGLNYHYQKFQNNIVKKKDNNYSNPFNIGAQAIVSFADDKTVDGPIYFNYGFGMFATQMYRGKSRAGLGFEGTYHSKLYSLFKSKEEHKGHEQRAAWQYSVFILHEFVFGKIGFPIQLGFYLNKPNAGAPIYQKLGISYHAFHHKKTFIKDTYLTLQLKTHYATADFAEWGIGFLF